LEESEIQMVHMQEWVNSGSSRRFPGQLFATCTAGWFDALPAQHENNAGGSWWVGCLVFGYCIVYLGII